MICRGFGTSAVCRSGRTAARIASSCAAGVPRAGPASRPHVCTFRPSDDGFPDAGASRGTAHCDLISGCPSMAIAASPVLGSTPLARCRDDARGRSTARGEPHDRVCCLRGAVCVTLARTRRCIRPSRHTSKEVLSTSKSEDSDTLGDLSSRAAARPTPKSLPTTPRERLDLCRFSRADHPRMGRRASATSGPCSADESETMDAVASEPSSVPFLGLLSPSRLTFHTPLD